MLAATPGIRIGSRINLGPGTSAHAYAGAGVSFLHGNNFEVDTRFAAVASGVGRFRISLNNDSIAGRFIAGASIQTAGGIDIGLQYQGRHSANQSEHGGQLRFAYRF